jgi:protein SMG8
MKYARGAQVEACEDKLRDVCTNIWLNGKQQCECLSLRGNPCIMGKHTVHEHSSGVVYVSACNCGRVQGRREDPYTVRQANFEFFQMMAKNCTNCGKLEKVQFPVFQPSTTDFKAAEISMFDHSQFLASGPSNRQTDYTENIMHLSGSQKTQSSHSNISIDSIGAENDDEEEEDVALPKDGPSKVTEDVEQVTADKKAMAEAELLARQVSTTEYLNIMVHTKTPEGLLPQFPSWSLVCVGPSSIYSHNTGLPEHVQSGFLSGANFLLPWDVQIGLENSYAVAHYEKTRHHHQSRKKNSAQHQLRTAAKDLQKYCNLKIFVGVEYECPRGHRFIMNSPTTVLRSSSEIDRDCGNKVVFNDMPIYFACPCRASAKPNVAQLMRIHIVTPKAPVNILLDPKVEIFGHDGVPLYFCTGLPAETLKLSQSTYWILRLPYVYHAEDGVLPTPTELPNSAVLMAGMYGIKECE